MKFNWGTGIILSFIIFALAIAYIVFVPFNQRVDLVMDDYYNKEIKYQEEIDKASRTELLNDEIKITHNKKTIEIQYPGNYGKIEGEIIFYRPSDSAKDFREEIKTDTTLRQTINTADLAPGLWKIKISWTMENQDYFYEKAVVL